MTYVLLKWRCTVAMERLTNFTSTTHIIMYLIYKYTVLNKSHLICQHLLCWWTHSPLGRGHQWSILQTSSAYTCREGHVYVHDQGTSAGLNNNYNPIYIGNSLCRSPKIKMLHSVCIAKWIALLKTNYLSSVVMCTTSWALIETQKFVTQDIWTGVQYTTSFQLPCWLNCDQF